MESAAQGPPASKASGFGAIREALRGAPQDFSEGPLSRAIWLLAVPMVLEMLMESLFSLVDALFVARLGPEAIAAVGVTESLLTVVYALAMGLSMATTAVVARRMGEKNPKAAAEAAVQAIVAGIAISALLGVWGAFHATTFLRWMGASPAVIAQGHGFTQLMLGGNANIMLLFLINAVFRGAGDATIAMRTLWIANGINMLLDPCLINGWGPFPRLGVTGAAVATNIGRGVGVCYQVVTLSRGRSQVRLSLRALHLQPRVLMRLLRLAVVGSGQILIATSSWMALVRILAKYGATVLAGYTIGLRILVFALLPSWGLSNAAATLVGQNLGAGKPERAEASVQRTGFYNMVFLSALGICFILFAPFLLRLFTSDIGVIAVGVSLLRFVSYGYPFYGWGMVLGQAFNGAGDTTTPMLMNVFIYWTWEIPLAWGLSRVLGPNGVFLAITIAESSHAICAYLLFRRGRWKSKQV